LTTQLSGTKRFPCPVCMDPREVRMTKKEKPYITCDPCGIQVFVRGPAGIAAFNRLVERAHGEDLWTRLREMQRLFYLKCPECGHHFWIEPGLAKTSLFDGSLQGFRCPAKNCREVVPWKTKG
jgi:DNA-directed RNA polymerase subunit RPC12/RpoP